MQLNRAAFVLVAACGSHADPQASPAKKADAAPTPVAAALPRVTGNVVVEQSQRLYPTEAAARAHAKDVITPTIPIALVVVADRGDVIEVTTKKADDCVSDYRDHAYELTVFVPRGALISRAAEPQSATYPDGTAVMIERGALIRNTPLAWREEILAAIPIAPAKLVLGTPSTLETAKLPAATGERLVCERDRAPELLSKWLVRERKKRAPSAASADEPFGRYIETDEQLATSARHCGVIAPSVDGKAIAPTVDGHALPWPVNIHRQDVFSTSKGLRADVEFQCGSVRMTVERTNIGEWDSGSSVDEGGRRQWQMRSGNVVWPDGSRAGTVATAKGYFENEVEVRGDLRCVTVAAMAEKVCYHSVDVTHMK